MHTGDLFASARIGAIAQLGERLLCKHQVVGSIPTGSTSCFQARFERDGGGWVSRGIRKARVLRLAQVIRIARARK